MAKIERLSVMQVASAQMLMKPGAGKLFAALVKMSKEGTERVYPAVRTLAHMVSASVRSVHRWLNELEDAGWIHRERRRYQASPVRNRPNLYTIMTALVKRANRISWGEFAERKFAAIQARRARALAIRRVTHGMQSLDCDMDGIERNPVYNPNYYKEKRMVADDNELYRSLVTKGLGNKGVTTWACRPWQAMIKR